MWGLLPSGAIVSRVGVTAEKYAEPWVAAWDGENGNEWCTAWYSSRLTNALHRRR